MYFMLGLFGLFFWLTELPIFLEMVFSNSQWLQRCLLGSGQLITTTPLTPGSPTALTQLHFPIQSHIS